MPRNLDKKGDLGVVQYCSIGICRGFEPLIQPVVDTRLNIPLIFAGLLQRLESGSLKRGRLVAWMNGTQLIIPVVHAKTGFTFPVDTLYGKKIAKIISVWLSWTGCVQTLATLTELIQSQMLSVLVDQYVTAPSNHCLVLAALLKNISYNQW